MMFFLKLILLLSDISFMILSFTLLSSMLPL